MAATAAHPEHDEFRLDEEHPSAGTVLLALHGDADLRVADDLRDRLSAALEDGNRGVVADLSQVTFLDSTVLGVLVGAMKETQSRGGRFRVVAPRRGLRRIFELTLLDRVLVLDASRRDALAAVSSGRTSLV